MNNGNLFIQNLGAQNQERTDFVGEIQRRRFALTLGLLRIYNYYRVFLGLTLLLVSAQSLFETRLGSLFPDPFYIGAVIYTFVNLVSAVLLQAIPSRFFERQLVNFALVLFDILALAFLMYCSGGVSSGIAGLILIAVAAGAIIVTGRPSTLLAAIAAITVLGEEFYLSLSTNLEDFFGAGVLGIVYFAFSLIIQNFSQRLRQNDVQALTQAAELADLERINRLIVQRMRTGIILVNASGEVRMANQSAKSLVGQTNEPELIELPRDLQKQLAAWRANTGLRASPVQVGPGMPEIRVNFLAVRADDPNGDVTIFLEDTGEIQQQAQQLKLASLGRLSASIAHEIRNPLGAVSHASQLLRESRELNKGDARLTDIIHDHCQRMNGVIQNVLEMSGRAAPKPDRLPMRAFLEEFVEQFVQGERDALINIKLTNETAQLRIDKSQMHQVLTNLVSNGLRYSRAATGSPTISLEGGIQSQIDRPYLLIIDDGPGVPQEQIGSLFEPFFTTESTGSGLGLYISKELCEANQARLSYQPGPNGESCFRIDFAHPDRITI